MAAAFSDITERKRSEAAIIASEQQYRLLFESANDGIFIVGESGFVDCNQRGAEMCGLPKEQLIGRSPAELSPPRQPDGRDSAKEVAATIASVMGGAPQHLEWQSIRGDGTPFDVELTLSPLSLGGKTYIQAIARDITERKLLDQERAKSQKLESIGTLAGGIAHDFNNLLQGIFGYITMAKMTIDQREKSLAMLEQAEKAIHQSVDLTTQLLTFSKGGKPVKKRMSVPPMIENAARFALSGSRSGYSMLCDSGLWHVEADEGQLGQVIQNLVLNADQAMPLGGTIRITAENVPAGSPARPQTLAARDHVLISIQDSGVGIPDQHLAKIFDPYFTTKEKGSGLGLATSYSIVKNHDGLITVHSEVGKGSTFLVFLPSAGAAPPEAEQKTAAAPARSGKILVMDDEALIRNIAREMLSALGHSSAFADKGEMAIEVYRNAKDSGAPFDVVILDLTIRGGMGGLETVRQLLAIDPEVKAVVSSGYSNDASLAEHRKQGFKASLKKPYDITELKNTLDALLSNQ